jgi:hypothetical protein
MAIAGKPQTFEWLQILSNGTQLYLEISLTAFEDEGNIYFLTIGKNIDDCRSAGQQLRDTLDNLTEFIVRWLPDGIRTYANQPYCDNFNITVEDAIGTSFFPLIPEEDLIKLKEHITHLSNDSPTSTHIHRVIQPDGSTGWQEWTNTAIYNDEGTLLEYQSIGRDITKQKQIKKDLRDSEEKFSKAFYAHPTGMALIDVKSGERLEINDRFCEMFGYPRDELLHKNLYINNHWVVPEKQKEAANILITDGHLKEFPAELITKSGEIRSFLVNAVMLDMDKNNLAIVSFVDITKQQLAYKKLQDSENKFRSILENLPAVVFLKGMDSRYLFINKHWEEIFHVRKEDIIGKSDYEIFSNEMADAVLLNDAKVIEANSPLTFEEFVPHDDGLLHTYISTKFPLHDVSGEIEAICGIAMDITERVQAEQELAIYREQLENLVKERTRELETANKELESFSYSVSHDLRAPLRSIDGFSKILMEDYSNQLDDTAKNHLNRIHRSTQRIGSLIDDLLMLSKVSRSGIQKEPVDLSSMVHNIAEELKESQLGRQVEFVIEKNITGEGDSHLLRITLENLISNAWKYTNKKTHAHISFGVTHIDNIPTYYVQDNGAGFNMNYSSHLFQTFKRLHGSDDFEGTGIGLSIVHRIIQRHGGKVWGKAEVDKGATFYFTLG